MCRCDHVNIVRTVAYRNGVLVRVAISHHPHDLCLLLGADSTSKHDVCALAKIHEQFDHLLVSLDRCQRFTRDNDSVISDLLRQTLVSEGFLYLQSYFLRFDFLQNEHVHGIVEKLAGCANINRCFDFITG